MDLEFTPRGITKNVVKSFIAYKTTKFAENVVAERSGWNTDSFAVKTATGIIGGFVASQLSPVTDYAVDKTADFVTAKWEARKAKKDKPDEKKD